LASDPRLGSDMKPINRANQLNKRDSLATSGSGPEIAVIPWLDSETAADVMDITTSVAEQHQEAQAVILFGSVARREERSLDDPEPSDVDLLVLVDPAVLDPNAEELTLEQELALTRTIGEADYRHRQATREVKTLFVRRDLKGWDATFIENVARDGLPLWVRSPDSLPPQLRVVASRDLDTLLSSPS
jgi:predicted nucleotidyltransferase